LFRIGLPQVFQRIAFLLLSLALLGYMGYLLAGLYQSRQALQGYQQSDMLRETVRRAQALEYFFSERMVDVAELAEDRELRTYFENRALGMSMRYGLGASLYAAGESFSDHLRRHRLGAREIYRRILFVDAGARVLVDIRGEAQPTVARDDRQSWGPFLRLDQQAPLLGRLGRALVISAPVRFKGQWMGHLLAWLSPEDVFAHFLGGDDPSQRVTVLLHGRELIASSEDASQLGLEVDAATLAAVRPGAPVTLGVRVSKGRLEEMQVGEVPVAGTPLALVTFIRAAELKGGSLELLIVMAAVVGVLIVLGGAASVLLQQKALRTTEQLLQSLPSAIVVLGKGRTIVLANEAAGAILASRAEALLGQDWSRFRQKEPSEEERPAAAHEAQVVDALGVERAILLAAIPVTIGGEEFQIQTFVDLSERKQLESQLRHAQKLEAVGQLAAGIAHEINTPTQFVNDSLHFLEGAFGDLGRLVERYREVLARIDAAGEGAGAAEELREAEEEADLAFVQENSRPAFRRAAEGLARIAAIVGAMKEFAHPGRQEMAAADLNRALRNTLTIARSEYKAVADVETDFGDLPQVVCHVADLNQVFLNLLVNSAHAIADVVGDTGARGRIRIRTASEGDRIRIEISDSGCGIPESIRDRVFDPFFTTKAVGRGSGQGLAIARSIVVEKHGGDLGFESVVGEGTTFRILLPLDGAPSSPLVG
jgi:signal transduction histidine kinase